LTAFVRWLTRDAAAEPVAPLIGAAQTDPEVARAWAEQYARPRRELARERLRVARAEGELRPGADLGVIVDQLWGACYHRLLGLRVPFDESLVSRLGD